MMKWILALALTVNAYAMHKSNDPSDTSLSKNKTNQTPAYDADLFRKDAQGYSGHVEILAWTGAAGGLDYAQKMQNPTSSFGGLYYADGNYETASYDVNPGFRAALSYFRAPHFWEIKWEYTRMTLRGKNSADAPVSNDEYLTATFPNLFTDPITKATSSIHLNYNVFDWTVDRVFFPNPHLRLRAVGGATTAWMQQNWEIHYMNNTPKTTSINNKWKFIGGGLKTGTVFDWYWTGDLYLTGSVMFGALVGTYSNHADIQTTENALTISRAKYQDVRGAFTVQFAMGPSWQKNFTKHRIELFAGYESNFWFNLQEVYRASSSTEVYGSKQTWVNSSLLTLYGLTTRCTFSF